MPAVAATDQLDPLVELRLGLRIGADATTERAGIVAGHSSAAAR
jgi:hypothetical protein